MILYHGTRRPFRKGGLLLPASVHGGKRTGMPAIEGKQEISDAMSHGWAYATERPKLAMQYALKAPGRGFPRILTVQPILPMDWDELLHEERIEFLDKDPEYGGWACPLDWEVTSAWRFRSAIVTGVRIWRNEDWHEA